jgi:VWFA-related protein
MKKKATTEDTEVTQRTRHLRGRILVTLATLALMVASPMAQQPAPQATPTFKSSTRLVVQTVTVKDKDGKPIEGLTAKDFTVTEDGELQTISFVEYQRLDPTRERSDFGPVVTADTTAAPGAPAQPSLPSTTAVNNATLNLTTTQTAPTSAGESRFRDRRLLILYFDLSAMPPTDQMRAYSAALKYIDTQIRPLDLVCVMTFQGGAVRLKQDFTDDHDKLIDTVNRMIYGDDLNGDGIPDSTLDTATAFGQDDGEFNIFNTDRQLSALQTAVSMVRPYPEQKSLVYFSSGLQLNGVDNQAQLRATTNAAIKANVMLFPVDARGLVASAPLGDATQASRGGLGMFSGQMAMNTMTNFQKSQDSLYAIAKDTGGKAMFDDNDLSRGIVAALNAQTSYYILGYYTTKSTPDGKYRRIKVTVNGGLSADLSYRQGYFADKEFAKFTTADKERQLEDALLLDNPVTEIQIVAEVNYFQLNRAEYFVPVAVKIPGNELALAKKGGASRTLIDFIGEVKDDFGNTIHNVRDKLDITLSQENAAQLASHPIQYETGFTLLPGNYVLKLLARDSETGRMGTYLASFNVPNLNKEELRLPVSSVVLSSQRVPAGDAIYNVKQKIDAEAANPLIRDGQKLLPSVTRVFSKSRDMYVYLQAYERAATTTEPLVAFVSFYRGDVKVLETAPLAVTDGLDPKSKAVALRFSVPLDSVAPGRYDCQVTVLDPASQKAAFWRGAVAIVP